MNKECNFKHKCEGELFYAVEGGYVCEAAIREEALNKCKWCGRYGNQNETCPIDNTEYYECRPGFGCKDYIEEDLEDMIAGHHFCQG